MYWMLNISYSNRNSVLSWNSSHDQLSWNISLVWLALGVSINTCGVVWAAVTEGGAADGIWEWAASALGSVSAFSITWWASLDFFSSEFDNLNLLWSWWHDQFVWDISFVWLALGVSINAGGVVWATGTEGGAADGIWEWAASGLGSVSAFSITRWASLDISSREFSNWFLSKNCESLHWVHL